MAFYRVWVTFLLLSCLSGSIYCALHRRNSRTRQANSRVRVVRLRGQPFKIRSTKFQGCLTYRSSWTYKLDVFTPSLTFQSCDRNTSGYAQLWQWTSDSKLLLIRRQRCLTANGLSVFLGRCDVAKNHRRQQWECAGRALKLRGSDKYLLPYWFVLDVHSMFGVALRCTSIEYRVRGLISLWLYAASDWTQYGRNATLCSAISKSDDDDIKCGMNKALACRFAGGTKARAKSWPWQVGIKSCPTCKFFCGGTIVAKKWVITAAHCLVNYVAKDLVIEAGVTNQSKVNKHKQTFKCTAIHSHQSFGIKAAFDEDIAVLELDKEVVFNDHVRPLCLNGRTLKAGKKCSVTGYGSTTKYAANSTHKLQTTLPIVDHSLCVTSYNQTKPRRVVTKNMLCAGFSKGGTDGCGGDSGGPLTCWDSKRQRYVLGGIVSWGVGCARANHYGVYTDVKHLVPWITKITGKIK